MAQSNNCNNCNHSSNNGIYVTCSQTNQAIEVSNNKSRYYAELALQYKEEAREFRNSAQYYAEQNSDVTMSYINSLETSLRNLIATKQDSGNYALISELPTKVSDLENDRNFLTSVPIATNSKLGVVKPDSTTISVNANGVLSTNSDYINSLVNTKITNCCIEVPQRIKLELNDGVLTLKAGSVITVPNGFESDGTTPHFDYVTIANDLTLTANNTNTNQCMLVAYANGNTITRISISAVTSGEPHTPSTYSLWYDTANNIIYRYGNDDSSGTKCSLPIAITTPVGDSTSNMASIDQVFQSYGYIGSVVWIDKDVKYLVPAGRNTDGSLKNNLGTTSRCVIREQIANNSSYYGLSSSPGVVGRTNISASGYNNVTNWNYSGPLTTYGTSLLGKFTTDSNAKVISMSPLTAVKLVSQDELDSALSRLKWVPVNQTVSQATAIGTYTIDLSSILPNDNCMYEIILSYTAYTNIDSYIQGRIYITNEYMTLTGTDVGGDWGYMASGTDKYQEDGCMTGIIPIGAQRNFVIHITGVAKTAANFIVYAYRKLGNL